jgi:O-antigen/teichoic acid export membrane protein
MSSSRSIIKGVYWTTILNVVNAVYGFISVPLLIGHFGKSEYGIIGLAMSVNVYMQLMDLGFNSTNVRFFSSWLTNGQIDKVKKAFSTSLGFYGFVGLLNAIVLLVVLLHSSSLFNVDTPQDTILKHLLGILMVSAIINWFTSCFEQLVKATENVAWVQKFTLLPKLVQIAVLVATLTCNLSIQVYFLLTTFSLIAIIPFLIKKIKKDLPYISFRPLINIPILKEILPYCLNIFSFSIFQFSFYNLRPVFLGMQGTIESVADYRILNGIIGIISMLGGAFTGVLLPSTSKVVAERNSDAYFRMAYDGTKYISMLICFFCFAMMAVGREVLTLYVGKEYLYLIPWFNVWLICTLGTHNQAISSLILAGSDIRAISYSSAVASIVGLVISWLLIPRYQIGGVVIGFVAYTLIQMLFYYLYYWRKKMSIRSQRVFFYSFLPYVVSGILCLGVISMFSTPVKSLVELMGFNLAEKGGMLMFFFMKGIFFTLLYAGCIYMLLTPTDRTFFKSLLKRKKQNS